MKTDHHNTVQKIGAFLNKDGAMTVARVLVGVMLGATMGLKIAPLAIAAISIGVVGLTAIAHTTIERQKKALLLDTYREEISHMLGKDEKTLTVHELQDAAKSPHNPDGSTALSMALDYFRNTRNFFIMSQVTTAALMVAALSFVGTLGVSTVGLAGAAGLLYNELFRTVTNIGSLTIDKNIKGTITKEIRAINNQISLGGRVSSTRVLGVLVSADPKMQAQIQTDYDQPYNELSIADKRKVVNRYAEQTDVVQITRDINMGRMLPTELAFIAFGESSGTPLRDVVPEMHSQSDRTNTTRWRAHVRPHTPILTTLAPDHATQLELEAESPSTSRTLH